MFKVDVQSYSKSCGAMVDVSETAGRDLCFIKCDITAISVDCDHLFAADRGKTDRTDDSEIVCCSIQDLVVNSCEAKIVACNVGL